MSSVQLYVYDLTNGMARQLSRQMTGRQIDGIWYAVAINDFRGCWATYVCIPGLRHTSVIVFGKEVFYGQGIHITAPGRSHVRNQASESL